MDNMKIYNKTRKVPQEALKTIKAGRLKGMSDINPMWRISVLTENFGPVGFGWSTTIKNKWLDAGANGEIVANVEIELRYYNSEKKEWSQPIVGIGGSMFIAKEQAGMHTSDEAYKMAYTDAISVACKALGIGADVYWSDGRTKYTAPEETKEKNDIKCKECGGEIIPPQGKTLQWMIQYTTKKYSKPLCDACVKKHIGKE